MLGHELLLEPLCKGLLKLDEQEKGIREMEDKDNEDEEGIITIMMKWT
jgi:hypothetical protein